MASTSARLFLPTMARRCRLRVPSHTRIPIRKPIFQPQVMTCIAQRPLTHSARLAYPRKDSQDKNSINAEANEYSKSGTDDDSARNEEAAFDPDITDPQQQKDKAGEGKAVS